MDQRIVQHFHEGGMRRRVAAGPARMDTTLVEMIARLKTLGAKNPCEHTKKLLTAIWLHLRGDGVNLHSTMRNCVTEMVKRKLSTPDDVQTRRVHREAELG